MYEVFLTYLHTSCDNFFYLKKTCLHPKSNIYYYLDNLLLSIIIKYFLITTHECILIFMQMFFAFTSQVEVHSFDEREQEPRGIGSKRRQTVGHWWLRRVFKSSHSGGVRSKRRLLGVCGIHVRTRGWSRGGRHPFWRARFPVNSCFHVTCKILT